MKKARISELSNIFKSIILILLFMLASCGGGGSSSSPANTSQSPQQPAGYTALSTGNAVNVADTFATLTGNFTSPSGYTTEVWFEYGTDPNYGTYTKTNYYSDLGNISVSLNISSLTDGTIYHFRFVTKNSDGTWYGSDNTFTTHSAYPASTSLASSLYDPQQLAVDSTNVYWTELTNSTAGSGSVKMTSKAAGGAITTLASGLNYPFGIAADSTYVYFTEENGGTLKKIPIAGGQVTTLASGLNNPQYVAVDSSNVYFTELGTWDSVNDVRENDGTIKEIPKNGGTPVTLASGLAGPQTIAVDSNNVYWTEEANYLSGEGTIKSVPIAGGPITTLVSGLSDSQSIALDTINGYIYYWGGWGILDKVPTSGGYPIELVSGMNGTQPLATDGINIYWTESENGGTLKKIAVSGGNTSIIAVGLQNPWAIAVDNSSAYWVQGSSFNSSSSDWNLDGAIMKTAK